MSKSNIFNAKQTINAPSLNKFDLSHEKKLSLNMGKLVPIYMDHVIPGDRFKVKTELFARFAPMLAPIMHRVDMWTHYYFVPNRLLWSEWEDFITGGEDGNANPVFPQFKIQQYAPGSGTDYPRNGWFGTGSLADYMGLPMFRDTDVITNTTNISALPFRAYQTIYNEYYRDQNLQTKIDVKKTSGDLSANVAEIQELLSLRTRAWEKDYFTSALPWPQKGGEAFAPVTITKNPPAGYTKTDGNLPEPGPAEFSSSGALLDAMQNQTVINGGGELLINELRKANKLQEWLEKAARGGSRYIEQIFTHFLVRSSDARLQRPEYLGGGKQHVSISEVLSTYDNSAADLPQGNMSGHGISSGMSHGFNREFEEHGIIIGIMSILPRSAYQQGIDQHWQKFDKFQHYWPSFASLGEQEIKGRELYYDPLATQGDGDETFAYQMRYAEYKFKLDTVHGDMRDSLAYWHLGRIFDAKPQLNSDFIKAKNEEMDRIFAVVDPDEHKIWCQIYNNVSALRPMPYFAVPHL